MIPTSTDEIFDIGLREGRPILPTWLMEMFVDVRNVNRTGFRDIEGADTFNVKAWRKDVCSAATGGPASSFSSGGGGVMSVSRGSIIEKSGVNMSVVWGDKYPAIESEHAGKPFVAMGVSLICHPLNPNAPIAHMNVRTMRVGEGAQAVQWIGGGADLTPMVKFEEDTSAFHRAMQEACERHAPLGQYEKYKAWCDEYFFIPHHGNTRGVGGIFFDYVNVTSDRDFEFLRDVGKSFSDVYCQILKRRVDMPYDEVLKEQHLYWRGRYAEFNLAYDRGTRFGLMTGGNTEAIFASLPPVVKW